MPLAFTPVTDSEFSPQKAAIAQEYFEAFAQRASIVGGGDDLQAVVGESCQGVAGWAIIQEWIAANCQYFLQSHNLDGTARAVSDLAGSTDAALEHWTFEKLCKSCGMWRSSEDYGWPNVPGAAWPADWTDIDDEAYELRTSEASDIRGPWVWEFLQRAFVRLKWTLAPYLGNFVRDNGYRRWSSGNGSTWAAATGVADAGWPASESSGSSAIYLRMLQISNGYRASSTPYYEAETQAVRCGVKVDGFALPDQAVRMTVLGRPTMAPDTWNANGSGLSENTWTVLLGPYDIDAETESWSSPDTFPAATPQPAWCSEPTAGQTLSEGWSISGLEGVVEWVDLDYVS